VKFISFILTEQYRHYFVAEFNSFFLLSDNIKQFSLLLLVLNSEVFDLYLRSFIFLSKLDHDFSHALNFLLEGSIVALNKENFLFLLSLLLKQLLLDMFLFL